MSPDDALAALRGTWSYATRGNKVLVHDPRLLATLRPREERREARTRRGDPPPTGLRPSAPRANPAVER